jgi:hypothetical protein
MNMYRTGWFALVMFGLLFFRSAHAASLFATASRMTVAAGERFSVFIRVSSADQAMNAAQGALQFPPELLEAVDISTAGSILTFWAQEPSYINDKGTVQFEGILPNPGFRGEKGTILMVTFRAKKEGTASLALTNGSVLANDGIGSQILSDVSGITLVIVRPQPPFIVPEAKKRLPLPPSISSPTHPDENTWYTDRHPVLSWSLPADATGVSYVLDTFPDTEPPPQSLGREFQRGYADVADGTWWFHLQVRNDAGWGKITHRRMHIDATNPDIRVTPDGGRKFAFDAKDPVSGISFVELQVDDGVAYLRTDGARGEYRTPALAPGVHYLMVRAADTAGNIQKIRMSFVIKEARQRFLSRVYRWVPKWIHRKTDAGLQATLALHTMNLQVISHARTLRSIGRVEDAQRLEQVVRENIRFSQEYLR